MLFDRFKAFRADHMLDPAGVFGCGLRIHAEPFQPGGEERMALIDAFSDLLFPDSVSVIYPSWDTVICPLSRSFFMATLTLGFLKFSSVATSTERTTGSRLLKDKDRLQIIFR